MRLDRDINDVMLDIMICKSKINKYSPVLEHEYYNRLLNEYYLELEILTKDGEKPK